MKEVSFWAVLPAIPSRHLTVAEAACFCLGCYLSPPIESFAKEDPDLKLKLPFFEMLLLLFSPSVSPSPLIVSLTRHLSGSPGDFRCLKKIFEDVQDTGGLSHLEGPLFLWCEDPFIDATFSI